jgi:hypothetical protein
MHEQIPRAQRFEPFTLTIMRRRGAPTPERGFEGRPEAEIAIALKIEEDDSASAIAEAEIFA